MVPQIKWPQEADAANSAPLNAVLMGRLYQTISEFDQAIFSILMAHALYSGVLA